MSKYALTFTHPDNYNWEGVDTLIIECDKNPLDLPLDTLAEAIANTGQYADAYSVEDWKVILGNDSWFVRNCDDVDVKIGGEDA